MPIRPMVLLVSVTSLLMAEGVVMPNDNYSIHQGTDLTYIHTPLYDDILPDFKTYQEEVLKEYTQEYGYPLDDTLFVGLASQNNQIANAFSTQIPLNSQIFYGAGAGMVDYFCFNSWLKTLLLHETAHNFQLNPKENLPSKVAHKVFGNTPITFLGLIPLFPIPNITESSFIFEGNSVLNESRFGNGGRLYSGYALAELLTQARAGKITPEQVYNETLTFPYGEKFYLIGGFFQEFLFRRYGIERVNGYFKTYATQIVPLFSNSVFKEQFGKDFITLLDEFVQETLQKHANFQTTKGEPLATSRYLRPMNATAQEIYALIGDAHHPNEILSINKATTKVQHHQGSWRGGEPFKIGENYYTQSSAKVSLDSIKMGLFDRDGYLYPPTESKVIQGYLHNGKAVYFDLKRSLEVPHIMIEEQFYDTTNSSVFIDKTDNLYYCKQKGAKRYLYRNKEPLFSWRGHYGFVVDVDAKGAIYFITNSPDGSTLYRYHHQNIETLGVGDDVVDFKLLNQTQGVATTINAEGFTYQKVTLHPQPATIPTITLDYLQESNATLTQLAHPFQSQSSKLPSVPYQPIKELKYSALNPYIAYIEGEGMLVNLNANFTDPLQQNSLNALLSYTTDRTVAGVNYQNSAQLLGYGLSLYGVDHYQPDEEERDHGYGAYLNLPLLNRGYWSATTNFSYTKAYTNIYRKPWTLSMDLQMTQQFGVSKYPNLEHRFSLFASRDRDSINTGVSYQGMHDFVGESYLGYKGSYMQAQKLQPSREKGIRISDSLADIQDERANIIMPTLDQTYYAKDLTFGELAWYQVINASLYFYSFPLSLQRETLYLKERYYALGGLEHNRYYTESIVGLESDLLFFHQLPIPLSIEWLYNDKVKDRSQFRFMMGLNF